MKGVTVALFEQNGISVFNEQEIQKAAEYLKKLEETSRCQTLNVGNA